MKTWIFLPKNAGTRLVLLIFCTGISAWVRPEIPSKGKISGAFAEQLAHVALEINGVKHVVKHNESVRAVIGDKIRVIDAKLNGNTTIGTVNLIGFNSPKSRSGDDRNIELSSFSLLERWSENKEGKIWTIVASSGNVIHGQVFLEFVEPILKFAVLDVNGKEMILRNGEAFTAAGSDRVKVKRVSTNILENADVFVQMIAVKDRPGEFEMRFLREKLIFARLPLKLEP